MPTEFDFLNWLQSQQQQQPSPLVRLGIGDDLAILNWPPDDLLLIGVDQVLDGVHFNSGIHSPRDIGKKAMNRNLSDCAAMAALPAAAVATVALPKGTSENYAKDFFLSMKQAADLFNCPIVGGDTASWSDKLVITVTILGRSAGISPITRSGAKPGDLICVTGPLGGSLAGRDMHFQPKIHLARELAAACQLTAMIDLSDGLSRDLQHICQQSNVGALIDAARLPLHDDINIVQSDDWTPADHAVNDGEDYELLFTCPAANHPAAHVIGEIKSDPAILWLTPRGVEPLEPKGWQHTF